MLSVYPLHYIMHGIHVYVYLGKIPLCYFCTLYLVTSLTLHLVCTVDFHWLPWREAADSQEGWEIPVMESCHRISSWRGERGWGRGRWGWDGGGREGETGVGRRREGGAGSGYSSNLISFWCVPERK